MLKFAQSAVVGTQVGTRFTYTVLSNPFWNKTVAFDLIWCIYGNTVDVLVIDNYAYAKAGSAQAGLRPGSG